MHFQATLAFLASIPLGLASRSQLSWTTYLQPAVPVRFPGHNYTFSATTLTLITGSHSAVLVDTPLSIASSETFASWLEEQLSPKNITLKYIYITHGHGDHFFGSPILLSHFPSATIIATEGTIAHALEQLSPSTYDSFWFPLFPDPDQIAAQNVSSWVALGRDGKFELEGHELRAVEVGQTDTYNTTVLHVPALEMVVAGDAVYGSCFQYLAESFTAELRAEWLMALVEIERLEPEIVVPSHRQEWDGFGVGNLARTREFLRVWGEEVVEVEVEGESGEKGKEELKRRVGATFPERVGDFIFEISASAAFPVGNSSNGTS